MLAVPKAAFQSCISSVEGRLGGLTERSHLHKKNPGLGLVRNQTIRKLL